MFLYLFSIDAYHLKMSNSLGIIGSNKGEDFFFRKSVFILSNFVGLLNV